MEVVHPTAHQETFRGWSKVEERRSSDSAWFYRICLPPSFVLGGTSAELPTPNRSELLGQYTDQGVRYQVVGCCLQRELDPQHWLEHVLKLEGWTVLSTWSKREESGWCGDIVASKEGKLGRFLAIKNGPQGFVVVGLAPSEIYQLQAERIFAVLASFEPLQEPQAGPLSELVQPLSLELEGHRVGHSYVPDSWRVLRDAPGADVDGFEALNLRGYDLGDVEGRLAFGVALRRVAKRPRQASELFLEQLRRQKVSIGDAEFLPEEAPLPFQRSWLWVSECRHESAVAEARCRVMLHDHYWVVAGLLGATREDDFQAWASNKRALDLATFLMRLKAPGDSAGRGTKARVKS
jgi:hypothetical protein